MMSKAPKSLKTRQIVQIEWFVNGQPLATAGRTVIDNQKDYNTVLTTTNTERIDSGTYKIVATNANGRDEAEVR